MDFKINDTVVFNGLKARIINIKWDMIHLFFLESKSRKWVSAPQLIKENNGN